MTIGHLRAMLLVLLCLSVTGCASRPDIRYYSLQVDDTALGRADVESDLVFSVESMIGDSAYEDTRIVYRVSPYRLDYYNYHRWTAPPGVMVSDFLRDAYEQSGYFRSVVAGFSPDAAVFLSGRVIAFEEVDVDAKTWRARVKMNLFLREAATGEVVWSRTVIEEVPVEEQTPEGVAAAMSTAVTRIVADTAPEFAKVAQQARDKSLRSRSRDKAVEQLIPADRL